MVAVAADDDGGGGHNDDDDDGCDAEMVYEILFQIGDNNG